jgi:hypothetical protein
LVSIFLSLFLQKCKKRSITALPVSVLTYAGKAFQAERRTSGGILSLLRQPAERISGKRKRYCGTVSIRFGGKADSQLGT